MVGAKGSGDYGQCGEIEYSRQSVHAIPRWRVPAQGSRPVEWDFCGFTASFTKVVKSNSPLQSLYGHAKQKYAGAGG